MSNDNAWVLLLLLFAYGSKNDPDFYNKIMKQTEEDKKRREQEKWLTENCEHIEWEQDMNAHIPFCKLNRGVCEFQCLGRKISCPPEINQDLAKLMDIMQCNCQEKEKE